MTAPCPSEDELLAFVQGFLAPAVAKAIESHVAGCTECAGLAAVAARILVGQSDPVGAGGQAPGSAVAPSALLAPGAKLGRYSILELVGKGAMSAVYSAYDPQLDRRVAIKLLRPDANLGVRGAEYQERLLREAQAMARLAHPNVLAIHDVGTVEGGVFLAMELLTGGTLREWLGEKPRGWAEVVGISRQAGEGLAAAHRAGIVHRDFKPDNVLFDKHGRVLVTDFGVARVGVQDVSTAGPGAATLPGEALALTHTGTMAGTPAYMAPEQFLGRHTGARADVFGFCAALYEALYGVRPFPSESLQVLREAVCKGQVREPPRKSKVPPYVRAAVLRGLLPEPEQRFQSMDALLRALGAEARRRWLGVGAAALALVALVAGAVGLREWRRATLPSGERTLWLQIAGAQDPDQEWLGEALQRIAARKLREVTRRYQVAAQEDESNVAARVRWRLEKDEVVLDADLGRTVDGRPRALPAIRAPSASEALDLLLASLGERLDAGQPERTPDAREQKEMAELGARSLAAYQLYQRGYSIYFAATFSDDAAAVRALEAAIAADPRWAHPYALLGLFQGDTNEAAQATVRRGQRTAELARDPGGATLLQATGPNATGSTPAGVGLLRAALDQCPGDLLLSLRFAQAAKSLQRPDDLIAHLRELVRRRPDLQFGADLALALSEAEHGPESARSIRDWAQAAPESEQALLSRAGLEFSEGQLADVERDLHRVLLVHGGAPARLPPIVALLLDMGKVEEARKLVERLLRGNEFDRARGRLQLGIANILEGRFSGESPA